jgi:hypothetical protein
MKSWLDAGSCAAAIKGKRRQFGCITLLALITCTLGLDFFHGIQLGEDRIGYLPVYRLRQSLAVALSRLHDPPLGGYLAYKSVVDVLSADGFALLDGDPGPRRDRSGISALLNDGPRLDRMIQQATDVRIDPTLPPELIRANELGLADYIYVSFRLFGTRISSLYYFLFAIVGVSCLLYAWQFREGPFLMFLLLVFAAELYFLENYARSYGSLINTVTNSRLFSGLSLLPALHILLVLWQRLPPRLFTVAAVIGQSLIFSLLLSCRLEAAWQLIMVVAVACGVALTTLLAWRRSGEGTLMGRLGTLWPAAILILVVSTHSLVVAKSADARYAAERKGHILWHEVLMGILSTSPQLRLEYVGDTLRTYGDEEVYTAVIRDLNARNDASSPIVRRLPNGQLTIDLMSGWGDYDKLAKSLTLRIIYQHPLAVLAVIPTKIGDQIVWFDYPGAHNMAWDNVRIPIAVIAVGALVCMAAGGFAGDRQRRSSALVLIAIVLLFAMATPMIHPSELAIGTLFAYLGAIVILAACGVARVVCIVPKPKGVSSPVKTGR